MEQTQPSPARRRPIGVLIVTVGLLLTSASAFLVAVTAWLDGAVAWATVPVLGETANLVRLGLVPDPVVAGAAVLVGLFSIVVAVGFFLLRSWGWTGLMLLAAVSLTINLVAVVIAHPNPVSMAVAIAAVLYANQRRIQLLFRGRQDVVSVFGAPEPIRVADVRPPG